MSKKVRYQKKTNYRKPTLTRFGSMREVTQSGSSGNPEGGSGRPDKKVGYSDRRLKENIVEIGKHSSGIALYLFDYKSEYHDLCGHGRQFGVMADEVERVYPEAVSSSPSGFKVVNYSSLGIDLASH